MDLHLSGKTAVVTGASKGIGLAIARALAGEGASVAAGARESTAEPSELARRATVLPVPVDLATPGGPGRLIEAAVATLVVWTSWSTTSARSTRAPTASSRSPTTTRPRR